MARRQARAKLQVNYYAFGLKIAALSSRRADVGNEGSLKNNYLYQGTYSELDEDIGWHDFALRSYDAQLGRFMQADPYDQFPSPYTGMGNDPINLVDPSGGWTIGSSSQLVSSAFMAVAGGMIGGAIGAIEGGMEGGKEGLLIGVAIGLSASLGTVATGAIKGSMAITKVIEQVQTAQQAGDIIRVNYQGYITSIKPSTDPYTKVIDPEGQELIFNDPDFDTKQLVERIIGEKSYRHTGDWTGLETRLFTNFSNKKMAAAFNDLNIDEIKRTYEALNNGFNLLAGVFAARIYLANLGHTKFDFSDDMAAVVSDGGNTSTLKGGIFPDDGTGGFIKFQGQNILYNVYDAGNFMTGKAYSLIGVSERGIKNGAHYSSMIKGRMDSNADQRAIGNGYNYKGVKWNQ